MPSPSHTRLLRQIAIVALLNTLIAFPFILARGDGSTFWWDFVYSQAIGLSILALSTLGRRWLNSYWYQSWRQMLLFMPLCVALGCAIGMAVGDALLDNHFLMMQASRPLQLLALIAFSLGIGGLATHYFKSREQVALARADAEAAKRQAAEARLRLLEAQLEPHMLFNTLANLRALIDLDPPRAITMLDSLNAFLRATLHGSRATLHPLSAEFDRLRDYLELMAVRMGPRLTFRLDLPDTLRDVAVPPLLLQALVENSIKHGLEPKVEGGVIVIAAREHNGLVTLDVIDTGVGMSAWPTHGGFGILQVRERLETVYGKQAAIAIDPAPEAGAALHITIPTTMPTP